MKSLSILILSISLHADTIKLDSTLPAGQFDFYTDGKKVLSITQQKVYPSFFFSVISTNGTNYVLSGWRLDGRQVPAGYYWLGVPPKSLTVLASPRTSR